MNEANLATPTVKAPNFRRKLLTVAGLGFAGAMVDEGIRKVVGPRTENKDPVGVVPTEAIRDLCDQAGPVEELLAETSNVQRTMGSVSVSYEGSHPYTDTKGDYVFKTAHNGRELLILLSTATRSAGNKITTVTCNDGAVSFVTPVGYDGVWYATNIPKAIKAPLEFDTQTHDVQVMIGKSSMPLMVGTDFVEVMKQGDKLVIARTLEADDFRLTPKSR